VFEGGRTWNQILMGGEEKDGLADTGDASTCLEASFDELKASCRKKEKNPGRVRERKECIQ